MLIYAIVVLALAAGGGLVLASSVLRGRLAPWSLSLLHAGLGAAGLVLVLLAVLQGGTNPVRAALVILVIAALGGFYLASFHLRQVAAPKPMVVVHATAAVAGFLVLAGSVLQLI